MLINEHIVTLTTNYDQNLKPYNILDFLCGSFLETIGYDHLRACVYPTCSGVTYGYCGMIEVQNILF